MTNNIEAAHWSEIDLKQWNSLSPYFLPEEIACNSDGSLKVNKKALISLNKLREKFGGPLIINSGYRTPEWNRKVGGSVNSQHLKGIAFDIPIRNKEMGAKLEQLARELGAGGIGRYNTFIHIDWRERKADGRVAEWGLGSWDT